MSPVGSYKDQLDKDADNKVFDLHKDSENHKESDAGRSQSRNQSKQPKRGRVQWQAEDESNEVQEQIGANDNNILSLKSR